MAFYSLEPWCSEVDDERTAVIASLIYNANRDPKARALAPRDFFVRDPQEAKQRDSKRLSEEIKAALNSHNAKQIERQTKKGR